jgi:autotransporter translocation and assembly factor TamB
LVRRIVSRVLLVAALLVALVGVVVVGGLAWLRSPWGNEFVRGQIESRLGDAIEGEVSLGGVQGNIVTGMTLKDLTITGPDGMHLLKVERVRARYSLGPLLDKRIVVGLVRLERPEIRLVRDATGRWNVQRIFARPPSPPGPPGWGSFVRIDDIQIADGLVDVGFETGGWPVLDWQENEFQGLEGRLEIGIDSREQNLKRFVARNLSFRLTGPALDVRELDGEGLLTPDSLVFRHVHLETPETDLTVDGHLTLGGGDSLALEIDAPRISLDETRRLFPQVRLDGTASLQAQVAGHAADPYLTIDDLRVETGQSVVTGGGRIDDLRGGARLDLDLVVDPVAPSDVAAFMDAWPVAVPLSGAVAVEGPPRQLTVDADVGSPAGAIAVRGDLDLRGTLAYRAVATSRDLDIGRLIGHPGVDLVLSGQYGIEGSGTGEDELDAQVTVVLERSTIYRWDVIAGATSGRLVGREYQADTVRIQLPRSVLRGGGTFGLSSNGLLESRASVESEDLGELWPGIGEFSTRARADLSTTGTYRGFDARGRLVAGDLSYAGFHADSFAGEVELTDVGAAFDMRADGTFHGAGMAGIEADSAAVDLQYAESRITLTAEADMRGRSTASLGGSIDFGSPPTTVALTRFDYRTPEGTWTMTEGSRLGYADGRVSFENLEIAQGAQALRVDGELGMTGESEVRFALQDVQIQSLAGLLHLPEADWPEIDAEGTLRGTRERPVLGLDLVLSNGISGRMDYADELARFDVEVATADRFHRLTMDGTVPMNLALVGGVDRLPRRPVDLHARGSTNLALIGEFVPALDELSGPIEIQVDIAGTSEAPRFSGQADLQGGALKIAATGVTYQDIQGRLTFDNDRITIGTLTGREGSSGRFEITGAVAMQNFRLGELDLQVAARGLQVMNRNRQDIQVNGEVQVRGTTAAPELTGRVEVDEAVYRVPERTRKNVINLDEAVIYVAIPGDRETAPEPTGGSSIWERSRVDLEVAVDEGALLTASNMRVEIGGDLSVFKPPGSRVPSISGTLEVRRGYYEEFGKRFTLEGGEVYFYGTPELNPGLHIVGTRTVDVDGVGDVRVEIKVGGTLRNLTIDLSSTPAYDKSEIIAIVLFGTPTPSASQQGQLTNTVADLVVAQGLAGPLQSALTDELNLDLLEVTQTEQGGDTATLFRVGKYVSPDVYVTYEQQVGGTEESQAVAIRYQISNLFAVSVTAGTRQSGIDFYWEYTY